MAKYSAFGTLLKRGATTVAHVRSISGPGITLDVEDVTTHSSTEAWEEVVATILRTGEIGLEIEYDPNDATHKNASGGLLYDLAQRASSTYSITFPSNPVAVWSFTAFVVGFEPDAPHEGALTAKVSLKISGKPTLV